MDTLLLAILSNNDIDEIILAIKSVQREPVATGVFPESNWHQKTGLEMTNIAKS